MYIQLKKASLSDSIISRKPFNFNIQINKDKILSANNIKVSVIIPVFNDEKYIAEAIESIRKQTLIDIEIIIVNDGSKDNSLSIINSHKDTDERIIVITQENQGLSASRNNGLKIARGEYIYFLDSDDYIEANTLEQCFLIAQENNLDILNFNTRIFFEDDYTDNFIPDYSKIYKRLDKISDDVLSGEDFYLKLNKKKAYRAPVWLQLIKSTLIKDKISFLEGAIYEDELFTMQALLQSERVQYYNKIFHNRRVRNGSIMSSPKAMKNIESLIRLAEEFSKHVEDNNRKEVKKILNKKIGEFHSRIKKIKKQF